MDSKPLPSVQQLPEELFKCGSQSIAYKNTVIKKIEPLPEIGKISLSVNEFLNSIKTETDNDHDYVSNVNITVTNCHLFYCNFHTN